MNWLSFAMFVLGMARFLLGSARPFLVFFGLGCSGLFPGVCVGEGDVEPQGWKWSEDEIGN